MLVNWDISGRKIARFYIGVPFLEEKNGQWQLSRKSTETILQTDVALYGYFMINYLYLTITGDKTNKRLPKMYSKPF